VAKAASENNIHWFKTFWQKYINELNLLPIPLDEC